MTAALRPPPIAAFAFVAVLVLAALAVRNGLRPRRLRAAVGGRDAAAGDGEISIGRIVAAYPTMPFLTTTLVAWLAPAGTPAPALLAAGLFALVAGLLLSGFSRRRIVGGRGRHRRRFSSSFHPALLRAVVGGPADMFLAALPLHALRVRSTTCARAAATSEVMAVGLALLALAFSHPMGAAIAFAAVPFLVFAVRPVLVARSAFNVVVALIFPAVFAVGAFSLCVVGFPGAGWSFFAAPARELSAWTAGGAACRRRARRVSRASTPAWPWPWRSRLGAPVVVGRARVRAVGGGRWCMPALVLCRDHDRAQPRSRAVSGMFGDPTAIAVAAPVLRRSSLTRVPRGARAARSVRSVARARLARRRARCQAWSIPVTVTAAARCFAGHGERERLDALAAGGAAVGRDGVLADTDNSPAFVLGRGRARGMLGPSSEPFALALLFCRHRYTVRRGAGSAKRCRRERPSRTRRFRRSFATARRVIASYTKTILGAYSGE